MSGRSTRRIYDECAYQQEVKLSTGQNNSVMDINRYVNSRNMCRPDGVFRRDGYANVDLESSLWGLDKIASDCDKTKHPFCSTNGCIVTRDPRINPYKNPVACERGKIGENSVVTTNMRLPSHNGLERIDVQMCDRQGNGYYVHPWNIKN